jgi:hypothetical protein
MIELFRTVSGKLRPFLRGDAFPDFRRYLPDRLPRRRCGQLLLGSRCVPRLFPHQRFTSNDAAAAIASSSDAYRPELTASRIGDSKLSGK